MPIRFSGFFRLLRKIQNTLCYTNILCVCVCICLDCFSLNVFVLMHYFLCSCSLFLKQFDVAETMRKIHIWIFRFHGCVILQFCHWFELFLFALNTKFESQERKREERESEKKKQTHNFMAKKAHSIGIL